MQTIIYGMDEQQGPTVQHRFPLPMEKLSPSNSVSRCCHRASSGRFSSAL